MNIERLFRKKALYFLLLATRRERPISAYEFFSDNFDLKEVKPDQHDDYRDYWMIILMEMVESIPQEKEKLFSIAFVEPPSANKGFRIAGSSLRYNVIAMKKFEVKRDPKSVQYAPD